jgi:hypothetical protein
MKKFTKELATLSACAALTACSPSVETAPSTVTVTPSSEAPKTTSSAPVVTTPARAACAKTVEIVSPENGAAINGKQGTTFTFNVCDLKGRSGWLLERTTGDTASDYTVVGDGEPSIDTEGQGVSVHDSPIGDEGITKQDVNIYIVAGGDACSDPLRKAVEDNGNQIANVPAACEQLGMLTLRVTN